MRSLKKKIETKTPTEILEMKNAKHEKVNRRLVNSRLT
jgi:hypothetical protein